MDNILSNEDRGNLMHALGATERIKKKLWGYRNHFVVAKKNSKDAESMLRLEALGLMRKGKESDGLTFYFVTEAGCKEAGFNDELTKKVLNQ